MFEKVNEGKTLPGHIKELNMSGVRFKSGKLILDHDRSTQLFTPLFREISSHLLGLLSNPELQSVHSILMVGGFSECRLLQEEIRVLFGEKSSYGLRILVPANAQLSVLQGAVAFGHDPCEVSARIARMTYGLKVSEKFDPLVHDKMQKVTKSDGTEMCSNVFRPIAVFGDEITFGEVKSTKTVFLSHENRVNAHVREFSKFLRRNQENSHTKNSPPTAVIWIARGLLGLKYEPSSQGDFPYELYDKLREKYGPPPFKDESKIDHFIHHVKIDYYNFLRSDVQSKSIYAMQGAPYALKHYTTDEECFKVGEVQIHFPPDIKHTDMEVEIDVAFGNTEITMSYHILQTNKRASTNIDFL